MKKKSGKWKTTLKMAAGERRVSSGTLCGTDSGRTIPVSEE